MEMEMEELLRYELPSIAEYISVGWMQEIVAWYTAHKVNSKLARYKKRVQIEVFFKK